MYSSEMGRMFRITDEGEREEMANFQAIITHETRYEDGIDSETILTIEGEQHVMVEGQKEPRVDKLRPIEVDSNAFAGLNWVVPNWGVRCVIRPGSGIKDDLRAAIQLRSTPKQAVVFRHMGWADDVGDGRRGYLHAGGAITAKGNDPKVTVRMADELSRYNLTSDGSVTPKEGVNAIFDLSFLADPSYTWSLIGGTLAPTHGPVDFAIHLTGRTGTFKSEIMALFQSFYGDMDSRHLPGSWSSTGNALEAQAFMAKNAAFVIDDFVPGGTSWQVKAYQANADKIIRAQGNQAGRARLTDVSNLQRTMYPRGIVLSTGEDTPEGHSVRARMLILEVSPGDIKPASLTAAQANRDKFRHGTAAYIQSLAANPPDTKKRVEELRRKFVQIGHSRTPGMLAKMIAVVEHFCDWAASEKHITQNAAATYKKTAYDAIVKQGEKQNLYLEDSDPVDHFLAGLRNVLGSGGGHIRSLNGGVPVRPTLLGWTEEGGHSSELPIYKSRGPCIGWVKWDANELYLEMNIGFAAIKKAAGADMTLTKQTLFRRLKDAGALSRVDDNRQRNTVRISAESHPRLVIALDVQNALGIQEGATDFDFGENMDADEP